MDLGMTLGPPQLGCGRTRSNPHSLPRATQSPPTRAYLWSTLSQPAVMQMILIRIRIHVGPRSARVGPEVSLRSAQGQPELDSG